MEELALGVHRYEPLVPTANSTAPAPETGTALARAVEREALALGFAKVGFAPAAPLDDGRVHLDVFRASGFAATMHYLMNGRRDDPRALLPEAKSAVVVALAYGERSGVGEAAHERPTPPSEALL